MTAKPVWHNDVERDAFVETHCDRCFQPDQATLRITGQGEGCPHLARADAGKLPRPWTRRRNAVMGDTYRCTEQIKKPPVNRRANAPADTPPIFGDLEESPKTLVPVEGWPDYRADARKQKEGDHQ